MESSEVNPWLSIRSINALFLQTHKYKMTIKGCFLEYF